MKFGLVGFLSISFMLHAIAAVVLIESTLAIDINSDNNTPINSNIAVELISTVQNVLAESPTNKSLVKTDTTSIKEPKTNIAADKSSGNINNKHITSNDTFDIKNTTHTKSNKKTETAVAYKPATKQANIQQVEAIIKNELTKYFYYPKAAQRKNWQGLVIMSFIIQSNGSITEIKVNKSSGYTLLDTAALQALSKVNKDNELALALNGHSLNQLLPITYQLTN